MTKDLAQSFGLAEAEGILVSQVIEDSPADDAGLRQGDIILQIDGDKVDKVATFRNRIALTSPGTKIKLVIFRDGKEKTIKVKIGKQSEEISTNKGSSDLPKIGLSLQNLSPEMAKRYGYENEKGVLVADVENGSLAARAGIRQGSLILEIDREKVTSVKQAMSLLKKNKSGSILLLVKEGDSLRYIVMKTK
jgi:serine protease Do